MQNSSFRLSNNLKVSQLFSETLFRVMQVSYYELKDFQCFRALLPLYQASALKQVLPFFIKRYNKQSFDFESYYYVSDTNKDSYKAGNFIKSKEDVSYNARIYTISIQDWFILQNLYFLKIRALKNMKLAERAQFYRQCKKKQLKFNQPLFCQGDKVQGIYYIIKGSIKQQQIRAQSSKNKVDKRLYIKMAGYFVGVQDIVANNNFHRSIAVSNCNQCLVLFIDIMLLNKYFQIDLGACFTQDLTCFEDSVKFHDQFYQPKQSYQIQNQFPQQENQIKLQFADFTKRFNDLNLATKLTSNDGFKKYIQNKKLVLRMRQSNQTSKQKLAKCKQQTDIFEIRNMLKGNKYSKKKLHLKKAIERTQENLISLPRQTLLSAKLNNQYLIGKKKHKNLNQFI